MGDVVQLRPARESSASGTVHVWSTDDFFLVSHESRSGDSWGGLEYFEDADAAVAAARAMARDRYMDCDVSVDPRVTAAMSGGC